MKFTQEEINFIKEEFGIEPEKLLSASDDELLELGDRCFDIELEGDISDGSKVPDRCGLAASVFQKISEL